MSTIVLDLDLDVGFDLGRIVQLLLSLGRPIGPIILKRVLPVIARISCVRWPVDSGPVAPLRLTNLVSTGAFRAFQGLVLFDDFMPDGHVFTLDDMHDESGLLDELQILGWLFSDQRFELTAAHEELITDGHEEVCIVREHFFFDDARVS